MLRCEPLHRARQGRARVAVQRVGGVRRGRIRVRGRRALDSAKPQLPDDELAHGRIVRGRGGRGLDVASLRGDGPGDVPARVAQ